MTGGTLTYDLSLDYALDSFDTQLLPRVHLAVEFFSGQVRPISVAAVLDSGADATVLDGSFAIAAGWTPGDIVERARTTELIRGIGAGRPIRGYRHDVVCMFGTAGRYAVLRLAALVTPPNTLRFPILGRADFFEQVDVTFVEFEKKLFFRFRNPEVLRDYP